MSRTAGTFLFVLVLALLVSSTATSCWAACGGTEEDRLVWARERMHPNADPRQLSLVYQWLLNSTRSCTTNGDLWYYRGLLARQLHNTLDASFSFQRASDHGSREQELHIDPFAIVSHGTTLPAGTVKERYALVIGVSKLANSDNFLEYGTKDARAIRDFLVKSANFKANNVTMLLDDKATSENIRSAFGSIHEQARAEDLVLVYISSHGRPHDEDPTGISYVLTYDTDLQTPGKVFSTALKMVELAEFGRFILAHDYVLLLDTCYSGAAKAGGVDAALSDGGTFDPLQGLAGSGNRVVISASRADERSFEDPASKHGFFTKYLLDALSKPAPSLIGDVFKYLTSQMALTAPGGDRITQHPQMQSYGDGAGIVLNGPAAARVNFLELASNK